MRETYPKNSRSTQFKLKFPKSSPLARMCRHSPSILKLDINRTWNITVTPASCSTCSKLVDGVDLFEKKSRQSMSGLSCQIFFREWGDILSQRYLNQLN